MFDLFSADQYLGLVENLSDWYLHSSGLTAWPAVVSVLSVALSVAWTDCV